MAFDRIPALPDPAHDPLSFLLDGRVGWHALLSNSVELGTDGVLRLPLAAASLPPLANTAGTLGNLVLPLNAAFAPDGTLLLLDRGTQALLRFDRCACEFLRVPGLGAKGNSPRNWQAAQGIAICRKSLFVCDPTLERVLVFALNGLGLREDLRPPRAQYPHWEPFAIAFDAHGRAFVTDRAFGRVHRFDRRGRWERTIDGLPLPTALAINAQNQLFVTVAGSSGLELRVLDSEGAPLALDLDPRRLAAGFPPLPFEVDSAGELHLGPWCEDSTECGAPETSGSGWFDPQGQPLPAAPPASPAQYVSNGELVLGPLDSRIADCTWHRLVLNARVPDDAQLVVSTFCSEQPLTLDQVTRLAEWATQLEVASGDWDGLVRSPPGRYLWLKLALSSSGPSTAEVTEIQLEYPRVGSQRYLPAVFDAEPVSADFTARFLGLFDTTLRSIEHQIDVQARLFDPSSAPATRLPGAATDFLTWLASWIGITLDRRWDESRRRRFLKAAGALFDCRGTLAGLQKQLDLVLGFDAYDAACPQEPAARRCGCAKPNCAPPPDCSPWQRPPLVLEHFRLRRWLHVGAGRLGSESVLWGSKIVERSELDASARVSGSRLRMRQDPLRDPFHVYAHQFSVFLPCRYRDSQKERRTLETLLSSESPGHTKHQLVFVEPRFRIGVQSMIGFDSVVGGVPSGVRLGSTKLEGGTTLTSKTEDSARQFAIGRTGRIAATTRIG